MKARATFLALSVATWAGVASAQAATDEQDTIIVTGNRQQQAETAAEQATTITLRTLAENPLPRHYAPICVKVFGIDQAYAEVLGERVIENVGRLGLQTAKTGCQPNALIGFTRNSKAEVERLRKQLPEMFGTLSKIDIERIFRGSGAAQAWHSTEVKNADGRPMRYRTIEVFGRSAEVKATDQYRSGRLTSPIRVDINGSVVVFDSARVQGRTIKQLADYATMRILAPVQDFDRVPDGNTPTILQLFAEDAPSVDGLTEFDWAYLSALYRLDSGATASAVHDATKKAMLDGAGQRLREKSGQP